MPERADPASLPPIPVLREQKTFTDSRAPGMEWLFDLAITCESSESDPWFMADRARRWEEEYVTGPKRIDVNGVFLPVERELCLAIAMLVEAEILATGESDWTFPQWVVWSYKAPTAFRDLRNWCADLWNRARPAPAQIDAEDETTGEPVKNA